MYGRDTWNQWEAWKHRYMSTMEPGRAILTVCGVSSVTSIGKKDSTYYKILIHVSEKLAIFQFVSDVFKYNLHPLP